MIKTFAQLKKIAATSLTLAAILLSNTAVAAVTAQHLYIGTTMKTGIAVTTPDGSKTLNAQWGKQPDLYDVWIANADFSKTYTAPKIIGWDFLGWYRVSPKTTNPYYYTTFPGGGSVFTVRVSADYEFVPQSGVELSSLYQDVSGAFNALFVLKYKEATYTVSFDTTSTVTWTKPSDMTATGGATIKLPTPNYNPGVVFKGWYSDKACTKKVGNGGAEYQPTKTIKLYAGWQPATYTMTFNPGQGTVDVASKTVTYGQAYGKLPIATREGYKFLYWTYSGNPITEDTIFATASDIIVKAEWEEIKYHIILKSNYKGRYEDLSGSIEFRPDYTTVRISTASTYKFTQPGLEFLGWDFDADVQTPRFDPQFEEIGDTFYKQLKSGETDVNLYAIWKVLTYTVDFDAGAKDATGTMSDQVIDREVATKLTKNAFTRTGYDFVGWSSSVREKLFADEEEVTNLAAVDQTVTLVAVWEAIKQKVSFDANWDGPAGSLVTRDVPEPIELKFGETKSIPAWTPVNTLAEFRGWSRDKKSENPEFTNQVSNLPPDPEVTLYAVWAKKDTTLSQAVGCDNLILSSVEKTVSSHVGRVWSVCAEGGIESGVIKANVYTLRNIEQAFTELTATLPTPGTLVFTWHVRSATGGVGSFEVGGARSATAATESNRVVYTNTSEEPVAVRWCAWGVMPSAPQYEVPSNLVITSVRWYPEGVNPEPTEEDAPVITADYSFKTDSMFDYVIEAKNTLTDAEWTTVSVVTGDGSAIPLPMTPSAEQPQRFFRVRVIRRGTE